MNYIINQISKALSVILYPLFVPTYGIALFCYAYSTQVSPLANIWILIAIIGTLLLTGILPISAIWILIRHGMVSSLQIENSSERTMPYIYTICGFCFWCYLIIAVLKAPLYIALASIGATIAITLVAIINHWWKISAHLTGFGGLLGGLMSYCLGIGAIPTTWLLFVWFGLSLILMCARLRLNAHTPAQVATGWLLGIICTFMPYCIYSYAA